MVSFKTIPLSKIKLGKGSIKFEKRQIIFYRNLVKKNPNNKYYQVTLLELERQLENDERHLAKHSTKKAALKKPAAKKPTARAAVSKTADREIVAKRAIVPKTAAKKSMAKRTTVSKTSAKKPTAKKVAAEN